MKHYETGLLIAPNLSEGDTEQLIGQVAEVISQREGKLVKQDRWGKRRLAYPIKKFNEALYVFFYYEGRPDIPLELERRFKQTDTVLRYLTLQKDPEEAVRRKRKKEKAEEAAEAGPDRSGQEPGEEVK
ncbi:MAG: 30S ribosomal protein S6 [Candidatus Aminicenantes bacterium]|nr:30S ribosomal protein S6 [Candidatus Aminicenantes bacterium]